MDQPAAAPVGSPTDAAEPPTHVTSQRLRFPLDSAILPRRLVRTLRSGVYEKKETEAIQGLLQKDDIVLELGGGIGYMSALAARQCPSGRVHTFEANPRLIGYIRRVHEANGITNVEVNHAILGPRSGEATFFLRKNLLASSLDRLGGKGVEQETPVEIRDAAAECRRIRPTVLICDIEGAEAGLLPALDLSTVNTAVIELHPQWIGPDGVRTVFETMMAAGLVYFARRSKGKVVCFKKSS